MAERSKASVLRSWKRKVVGSNPGDAKFDHRFSFGDWVDCKKETVTTKITTITRGDLNQLSSIWICGVIYNICQNIDVVLCYKKYRS